MADDRYGWLDEETAERLLRRLPVDAEDTGARDSVRQPGHPTGEQPDMAGESDVGGGEEAPKSGKGREECGALDVPSDAWFRDADRRAAAKLAAVLDELAAEHAAPGTPARGATAVELPGEAAALNAFRAARTGVLNGGADGLGIQDGDSVSASGSLAPPGFAPEGPAPGEGRGAGGGDRRARGDTRRARGGHFGRRAHYVLVGRPLRAGFAIALAGCALGGVAVAAGTGVLPTPFSGDTAPAVTMSPAASPEGDRSANEAAGGAGEGTEDTAGGKHRRHKDPEDEKRTRDPDDPEDPRDLANSGGGGKQHDHDGAAQDDSGTGHGKDGKGGSKDGEKGRYGEKPGSGRGSASHKQAIAAALCKAYNDGKLEARDRRKLERAAGGRAVVRKFCGRYGKPGGGGEGGEQSGGSDGSGAGGGNGGPHVPGGSHGGGGSGGGDGDSGAPGHGGGSSDGDADGSGAAGGAAGAPSAPAETGAPRAADHANGK